MGVVDRRHDDHDDERFHRSARRRRTPVSGARALGTLPDRVGDDTMATPALLALLLNAVAARRHLADLEAVLADQIEATAHELTLVARSRDPWP